MILNERRKGVDRLADTQRGRRIELGAGRACESVTVRVVNVFDSEMEEGPGRDGFWFRAAELGATLGGARIGATVYEARAGVPIWPYHYHYPAEEWLYVLEGAPVLRDAGGRRALKAGDVVCFPAGHRGAHTRSTRYGWCAPVRSTIGTARARVPSRRRR